jgi:hypothetical protein
VAEVAWVVGGEVAAIAELHFEIEELVDVLAF